MMDVKVFVEIYYNVYYFLHSSSYLSLALPSLVLMRFWKLLRVVIDYDCSPTITSPHCVSWLSCFPITDLKAEMSSQYIRPSASSQLR